MEEKMEEKKLESKIRNLKIKKSIERRETTSRKEQPAEMKRKINEEEHIRVLQEDRKKEKRKIGNEKYHEIFINNTMKKKKEDEEDAQDLE